jgi:N-acetylmuramoyl-L-alanine amidase
MPYNVLAKPVAVVALDIGHGVDTFPPDKGVYRDGKGYAEHNFNSKLAIEIEEHLKQNGFKVVKIQEPFSADVPLKTRTDFYNEQGVDLVWSIHGNAGTKNAKGICAFYWHNHAKSKEAAKLFVEELNKAGFDTHGNGLHASMTGSWTNLHIVRETKMTAVLTENGFMTNPEDFENIFGKNQADYMARLSVVHAKAICRYFKTNYKEEVKVAAKDINKVSPWADENWKEATENGYFDGTRPGANITREEAAIVVNRLRGNFIKLIKEVSADVSDIEERLKQIEKEAE